MHLLTLDSISKNKILSRDYPLKLKLEPRKT